ncbi:MAG TPA: rhodanese-like domain-containing protein [Vitreimonas sp.]|uniref:rhodanese-like domain-containing protein n=1 Tax=Vitreimonas sp. TaxID=3069702 RepID=UPI002D4E548A|nr:rhodanese-like domain-containing protein [Vitreimonas sp.]HYD88223.1 rhodanese-like domain-containing protein [Vitreimonas sp.]
MRLFIALAAACGVLTAPALAQEKLRPTTEAQIDYRSFRGLTGEVEAYRAERLISLADFQRMAREPGTIVLDARSADAYAQGHIEGAVNLPFTDFTDQSLRAALRDPGVRILIYCNNNFSNNAAPVVLKRVELALNIQTFINLYGYGYRNVYELGDVVDFNDPEVGWVRGLDVR